MVNLSVEEPDALMRARPDLWEPRGGNTRGHPARSCEVKWPKQLRWSQFDQTDAGWKAAKMPSAFSAGHSYVMRPLTGDTSAEAYK